MGDKMTPSSPNCCSLCRDRRMELHELLVDDPLLCNGHKRHHHLHHHHHHYLHRRQHPPKDSSFRSSKRGRYIQQQDLVPSNSAVLAEDVVAAAAEEEHPAKEEPEEQEQQQQQQQSSSDCLIPGLGDDVARLCLARVSRSSYGLYYTVSKRFCALLRSGELYTTRRRAGIVEQWVYMLNSGSTVWQAFCASNHGDGGNPAAGRWRPLPETPADPVFGMCDKESFTAGTQLLVVGRELSGPTIWGYDLVTDRWFRAPPMLTPRCLLGSASSGVYAYIAGGLHSERSAEVASAERYDSSTRRWERLPDMNKRRKMCSGFFMDGKFYVIGGVNSEEGSLRCGEEFDPETRCWRHIPSMCPPPPLPPPPGDVAAAAPPLVAVAANQLYSLDSSSRTLLRYCKRSNTWRALGEVPVRAESSSGWGLAFKAVNGQLLLINGNAIFAWAPQPAEEPDGPVQWRFLADLVPADTFVFNCAVMSA